MDWLTFTSTLIDSLAWPIAIVLIVWWLRNHISTLLPLTKRFKYGELEIEFEQELEALKQEVRQQRQRHPVERREEDAETIEYLQSTAKISPRTALVEAWIGLELTARSWAKMLNLLPDDRPVPFQRVIQALHKSKIISSKDVNVIRKLQDLRNNALHSPSLSVTRAEVNDYIDLTRDQADLIAGEAFQKRGGCGH